MTKALNGLIDESLRLQPKRANVDLICMGRTKTDQDDHFVLSSHLPYLLDHERTHGIDVFTEHTQVIIKDYSRAVIEGSVGMYRVKYRDI